MGDDDADQADSRNTDGDRTSGHDSGGVPDLGAAGGNVGSAELEHKCAATRLCLETTAAEAVTFDDEDLDDSDSESDFDTSITPGSIRALTTKSFDVRHLRWAHSAHVRLPSADHHRELVQGSR